MENTIEIELDHSDFEVSVNTSKCFLTNKEITALVTILWEYSWNVEGDFEATNEKNKQWFIFSLPFNSKLELIAEKLREKIQKLFPNSFVNIG